jgi:hypothetical protein
LTTPGFICFAAALRVNAPGTFSQSLSDIIDAPVAKENCHLCPVQSVLFDEARECVHIGAEFYPVGYGVVTKRVAAVEVDRWP